LLFRKKEEKTILLGLNEISICLARKISLQKDVIILEENNRSKEQYFIPEADVIIEELQNGLFSTLKDHQINNAGYFMALTEDDEYNLFAAELSKKLGVDKAIALIHNYDYTEYKSEIDLIFDPYQIFIDQMCTRIKDTGLMNIKNIIPGRLNISKIMVKDKDPYSYQKIKGVNLKEGIVIAVQQGKIVQLSAPDLRLLPGNSLFILHKRGLINMLFKKKLFIFGGSPLGLRLIKYWKGVFEQVIIIESNLKRCEQLAIELENNLILHGEGTDLQLLKEEGLGKNSVFLAVSQDDPQNLLSSFSAQKTGCNTVITLLTRHRYIDIANMMGLDHVLSLPDLVSNLILDFIKTGLKMNRFILGDEIYTMQISVKKKSTIAKLNLPTGLLIGVIMRDKEIIIPDDNVSILPEDNLLVFYDRKNEPVLRNIFHL